MNGIQETSALEILPKKCDKSYFYTRRFTGQEKVYKHIGFDVYCEGRQYFHETTDRQEVEDIYKGKIFQIIPQSVLTN